MHIAMMVKIAVNNTYYTVNTDWLKQPYFLVATFLKFVILTNCELVSENDQLNLVPLTLFNWSK